LDVFTNDTMAGVSAGTGLVAEIIFEEMEESNRAPGGANAHFILRTDPLDGSSNTDANGPSVRFSRFTAVELIREATSFAGAALNRWRPVT
jgi:hypothetical protein